MKKEVIIFFLLVFAVSIAYAQEWKKIGDEISVGDHKVKVIDIGSSDALFDVDGGRVKVPLNNLSATSRYGVNITVDQIFYHINPVSRQVYVEFANVYSSADICTNNSQCNDNNPCTIDKCTGNPRRCDYEDSHFEINYCLNGDGCCNPEYCGAREDNDCSPDPTCTDDDDCLADRDISTKAVCEDGKCTQKPITECIAGDGFCPDGCYKSLTSDQDCNRDNQCVRHSDCVDGNSCTIDVGCVANENGIKECKFLPVQQCKNGDNCCPEGCKYSNDIECSVTGEVNTQQGGTESYACEKDEDCSSGRECVDFRCVDVAAESGDKGPGIFSRFVSFLKKLFLPGG